MNRCTVERLGTLVAVICLAVVVAACGGGHPAPSLRSPTTPTSPAAPLSGTGATSTVAQSPTTTSPADSIPGLPSTSRQIAVLDNVLARIKRVYAALYGRTTPGPEDIDDYDIAPLWRQGIDGAGTTVAVLEGWKDPSLGAAIEQFDGQYDLPAAHISVLAPPKGLPSRCPVGMVRLGDYGSCAAWAGEIDLDVEAVHLIAPYARILFVQAPADSEGVADAAESVAPPEMMEAVERISRQHLANVISVSDGNGESTYSHGREEILAQDPGELAAAAAGVPLIGATGDCGVVQELPRFGSVCEHTTPYRSTDAWADSPWVTAVGGSVPNLNAKTGAHRGPDPLWHGTGAFSISSAGSGISTIYARPSYQNAVASITHTRHRSLPDITMDATEGTSESAPLFAGIMALATQANGDQNLGPINPALYKLGPQGARAGIADVIGKNNSFEAPRTAKVLVPGDSATRGFDLATGWGTVNAARFVPALVSMTSRLKSEASARGAALAALTRLETGSMHATRTAGGRVVIRATGLMPDYPVTLRVGHRTGVSLRANAHGALTATFAAGRVGAGAQTVTLQSLLITETARLGS